MVTGFIPLVVICSELMRSEPMRSKSIRSRRVNWLGTHMFGTVGAEATSAVKRGFRPGARPKSWGCYRIRPHMASAAPSQAKHILHVIATALLPGHPARGAHRPLGKSHAARCLVGNLDALPFGGEHHRMLTDDIAGTQRGKTDLLVGARSTLANPLKYTMLLERTPQALGDDLAHLQCCTRGRIDLVAMVRLDHLDIIAFIPQRPGCRLQQF